MAGTTRNTAAPAAPEYDFDNWDEEAEEKAIAAAVPDVRMIIVERRAIGRLTDGMIVEAPLSLTLDEVDEMSASGMTPVDQFKVVLRKVGGDELANDFGRRDMVECAILAEKYFRLIQRIQQAAFPES